MGVGLVGPFIRFLFEDRYAGMEFPAVLPCTFVIFNGIGDRLFIDLLPVKEGHCVLDILHRTDHGVQIGKAVLFHRYKGSRLF